MCDRAIEAMQELYRFMDELGEPFAQMPYPITQKDLDRLQVALSLAAALRYPLKGAEA